MFALKIARAAATRMYSKCRVQATIVSYVLVRGFESIHNLKWYENLGPASPTVTVVVPTLEADETLDECLASLEGQTFSRF